MTSAQQESEVTSDCPDVYGRTAIYVTTLTASILLLIAHHGIANDWLLFESRRLRCIWFSEAVLVPLLIAFIIRGKREAFPWLAGIGAAAVIATVASYTGGTYVADLQLDAGSIFVPYAMSLAIASFVLLPFVQIYRDGRQRYSYARLYELCWDNALTLVTACAFTLMCWLILWLCGSLFSLIGIAFFRDLFNERVFIYPVSGLFFGLGIALGRGQIGAMRVALKICMSLARPLLPMITLVATAFLCALIVSDLQLLWSTRHAASLLLTLVLATVALVNGVFQDGTGNAPYNNTWRLVLSIALLSLPIFSGIAAYALYLRVDQHGWSVDRLYAALVTIVAAAYAFTYALAALMSLRTNREWLGGLPRINSLLAFGLGATLLLIQSSALDFRQISLDNQLQRLEDGRTSTADFDLRHLRYDLGLPGYLALKQLKTKYQTSADTEFSARIDAMLLSTNRYAATNTAKNRTSLLAAYKSGRIQLWPQAAEVPEEMLHAFQNVDGWDTRMGPDSLCTSAAADCWLFAIELNQSPPVEWVFLDLALVWQQAVVFAKEDGRWVHKGYFTNTSNHAQSLRDAIIADAIAARRPPIDDLHIGDAVFRYQTP